MLAALSRNTIHIFCSSRPHCSMSSMNLAPILSAVCESLKRDTLSVTFCRWNPVRKCAVILMYESFASEDQMSVVSEKKLPFAVANSIAVFIFWRTFPAISGMIFNRNVFSLGTVYLEWMKEIKRNILVDNLILRCDVWERLSVDLFIFHSLKPKMHLSILMRLKKCAILKHEIDTIQRQILMKKRSFSL